MDRTYGNRSSYAGSRGLAVEDTWPLEYDGNGLEYEEWLESGDHDEMWANVGAGERALSAVAGGVLLGVGLARRSAGGAVLSIVGAELLRRGVSGRSMLYASDRLAHDGYVDDEDEAEIAVDRSITIRKPHAELYAFWRRLENLPEIMAHLKSVEERGERSSHWVARGPLGLSVSWDATITEDVEGRRIAWRSDPGSTVPNRGSVEFREAPAGRGTELRVRLSYRPPAGAAGAAFAKLFGEEPNDQVAQDLRNLKRKLETGEIATTDGQTSGRT